MIDHVSIAVRDLAASARFYGQLLAPLGYTKLVARPATIGFGKKYPELC
jgi:catechol 2,3-dioxygenase-like lactoylglutathione lyase family enzyme